MPLNIKNPAVERLADEVARLTGENKTELREPRIVVDFVGLNSSYLQPIRIETT